MPIINFKTRRQLSKLYFTVTTWYSLNKNYHENKYTCIKYLLRKLRKDIPPTDCCSMTSVSFSMSPFTTCLTNDRMFRSFSKTAHHQNRSLHAVSSSTTYLNFLKIAHSSPSNSDVKISLLMISNAVLPEEFFLKMLAPHSISNLTKQEL